MTSTFTFMRGLSYIAFIFFNPRKIYVRTHGKIAWWWKSTFSLKMLNMDHSIVNDDVRRDMLTEKLQICNCFFTTHLYPLF